MEEGYLAEIAADGISGFKQASKGQFDLLIVDWRLPGMSGKDLVLRLRSEQNQTPALLLTALNDVHHRVMGLDAGADDYLGKPFSFEELLARIRALMRRGAMNDSNDFIRVGPLTIRPQERSASLAETQIDLRSKEYLLLETLARRPGHAFSRTLLCEKVWGAGYAVSDNTIDVTISHLRTGLEAARQSSGSAGINIETIRGTGYRLTFLAEGGRQ